MAWCIEVFHSWCMVWTLLIVVEAARYSNNVWKQHHSSYSISTTDINHRSSDIHQIVVHRAVNHLPLLLLRLLLSIVANHCICSIRCIGIDVSIIIQRHHLTRIH